MDMFGERPARGFVRVRRWAASLVVAAIVVAGIVVPTTASANTDWTCPLNAPTLYRLTIDDVVLQREADKVGVCGDLADTFLVIKNSSRQPITFESTTPGARYWTIEDYSSLAVSWKNATTRSSLESSDSVGPFILAGEAVKITGRAADFTWEFSGTLTTAALATDFAASILLGNAKKLASAGSKAKAAVATCAFAATAAGATAENMDDVLKGLMLGATPCALAVENANSTVGEKTLLQRMDGWQKKLQSAESFVKKVSFAEIFGRVILRSLL